MRPLVVPLLALAGWSCAALLPPILARADPDPPLLAETSSRKARDLLARTNALTLELADAKERARIASVETDRCRAESDRWERSLERAVEELNRSSRTRPPTTDRGPLLRLGTRRAAPRRSSGAASERPALRTLKVEPSLQVLGDRIFVRGRIRNREDRLLSGRLTIELQRDGRPLDKASRILEVPVGGAADFENLFFLTGFATGDYTAEVIFVYGG